MNPFLTLALDGCQWSASQPSLFNSGKRKLGKAQSQYGGFGEQKVLFLLTGIKPQTSTLRTGKLHIIYEDSLFFFCFVFQAATKKQKYEKISEKKMSTPVEVLCKVNIRIFSSICGDRVFRNFHYVHYFSILLSFIEGLTLIPLLDDSVNDRKKK